MKTATVWLDPETRIVAVRTPYDPAIVASLKTMIPGSLRRWDGTRKIWLVDQTMMPKLEELLARLSYHVEDGTLAEERTAPANGHSPYHDLLVDVPEGTLRKVYRVLAIDCHPDRGGSTELMAKINTAWAEIEQLRR